MYTALTAVQVLYPTVQFNRFERKGRWIHFTLKAKSGEPGSRNSYSGRKGPWAAWEAHGMLFDKIFELEPQATIYSMGHKQAPGVWQSIPVGSLMNPMEMSQTDNF
jgi:hypothetical protein